MTAAMVLAGSEGSEARALSVVEARAVAWLLRLHALVGGRASEAEAAERVQAYVLIARRFPAEAYTEASLEHVAAASRFWPSYGELVERLGSWWAPLRQAEVRRLDSERLRALPAPDWPPQPNAAERAAVRETVRALAASLGGGDPGSAMAPAPRPSRLSGERLYAQRNASRAMAGLPPLPRPASFDGYGA